MTRYDRIINLGDEFLILVKQGLIAVTLLDWKVYYEAYVQQRETHQKNFTKFSKEEVVRTVAEHYDISRSQLFRIISFMEGA